MKKALITGITGFAGSHLADRMLLLGNEVYGIKRFRSDVTNIKHILNRIHLRSSDILDPSSLDKIMAEVKPHEVYHLAANSYVPDSWDQPAHTFRNNIGGCANVLEAVRNHSPKSKVLIVGSSEEYGIVKEEECPINEDQPLRPASPYAVSKVACDMMGVQYHKSYGLHVIVSRAFNHTGPRRHEKFVVSNFAKQIVEANRKKDYTINVGNLDAIRDFTDVRDTVAAYEALMRKGKPGEVYNICSGEGHTMKDMLTRMMSLYEAHGVAVDGYELKQDPKRMRPSDVPRLIGNSQKIHQDTGWKPRIPFTRTLLDTLVYWRENTK